MQNLFHSVQLNVNNPHFLIMQGRITKARAPAAPRAPPAAVAGQPQGRAAAAAATCGVERLPPAAARSWLRGGCRRGRGRRRAHACARACGRAQVLNMKPPEILGMLEEAAGTRMYEMKKDAALRTLEKKQVKVEEINAVRALGLGLGTLPWRRLRSLRAR